jgi:A/G-specific adenine glycosylase
MMPKKGDKIDKKSFAERLLGWNKEENRRKMPWKGEKDPYKIWLSEIILQQTRVEQGLKYYNSFVSNFPTIEALAAAKDEKIFKLWEGLGYYSRCRNLIITARLIADQKKGKFPNTYDSIKALKGIGPYTAAAISSFAFNLPHAVVDGNVFRVLSRIFGITKPIDSTEGKNFFTTLANELLDKKQPGLYNQSIMDFGAMVCKPASPLCQTCVFNKSCFAFLHDKVNELPVKEKKISIKKRWFYFLVIEFKGLTAIRQRIEKDIWQQLYEFPLIESKHELDAAAIMLAAEKKGWLRKGKYELAAVSGLLRQQLSHQLIAGKFFVIQSKTKPDKSGDWQWITGKQYSSYAFPRFINQYLERSCEL